MPKICITECGRRLSFGLSGTARHCIEILLSEERIRAQFSFALHQRRLGLAEEGPAERLVSAPVRHQICFWHFRRANSKSCSVQIHGSALAVVAPARVRAQIRNSVSFLAAERAIALHISVLLRSHQDPFPAVGTIAAVRLLAGPAVYPGVQVEVDLLLGDGRAAKV